MKSFLKTSIIVLLFLGLVLLTYMCKIKPGPIIPITSNVTEITQTSAVSGGNITADKGDNITSRGVCWSTEANPTITNIKTNDGNGKGSFVSTITGLKPGTIYYVRAYATNNTDTAYGSSISFTTQNFGTLTDIEGNVYKTVTIGTQTWMANNLTTTKYYDGSAITLVKDETAWAELTTPGYCWYKNDEPSFKPTYGALYNWYTVNSTKLCPRFWHVPSDLEWTTLTSYLGGESVAGGKLKEIGTNFWVDPNSGATNTYGFTAFPGGFRYSDGKFFDFGFSGYWWSSSEYSSERALFRFIYYEDSSLFRFNNNKKIGFSVRCLKD